MNEIESPEAKVERIIEEALDHIKTSGQLEWFFEQNPTEGDIVRAQELLRIGIKAGAAFGAVEVMIGMKEIWHGQMSGDG